MFFIGKAFYFVHWTCRDMGGFNVYHAFDAIVDRVVMVFAGGYEVIFFMP